MRSRGGETSPGSSSMLSIMYRSEEVGNLCCECGAVRREHPAYISNSNIQELYMELTADLLDVLINNSAASSG